MSSSDEHVQDDDSETEDKNTLIPFKKNSSSSLNMGLITGSKEDRDREIITEEAEFELIEDALTSTVGFFC